MKHDELEDYINSFQFHQREVVYKQILDSEILEKAFSTTEGKLILNSAVDIITSNILKILDACIEKSDGDDLIADIYKHAAEINLAHKMMTEWAKILISGNGHKTKMKGIKK